MRLWAHARAGWARPLSTRAGDVATTIDRSCGQSVRCLALRAAALGICAILASLVVAAGASAQAPPPPGSGPPGVLPSTPPAWFDEGAALIRQANPAMSCAIAPGATSVVDSDCNLNGTSFGGLAYGSCGTTNDVTPQGIVTFYHCVFSYALNDPPDPWIKCSGGAGPWSGRRDLQHHTRHTRRSGNACKPSGQAPRWAIPIRTPKPRRRTRQHLRRSSPSMVPRRRSRA